MLRHLLFRAALAAVVVVAFCTVADVLFLPLHRRRVAQGILGGFNGLSRTLQIPALVAVQVGAPRRFGREFTLAIWATYSGLTFLSYSLLFFLLGAVNRRVNRLLESRQATAAPAPAAASGAEPAPAPRTTLSRRRFLRTGKSVVVAGGAVA